MDRTFHVYFMASRSGVLYLGVTGKLAEWVFQHKEQLVPGFTQKYNVTKLVWFEPHASFALQFRERRKSRAGAGRRKWR
jgi:putative endonuclease